jgi:hypothetical protein
VSGVACQVNAMRGETLLLLQSELDLKFEAKS